MASWYVLCYWMLVFVRQKNMSSQIHILCSIFQGIYMYVLGVIYVYIHVQYKATSSVCFVNILFIYYNVYHNCYISLGRYTALDIAVFARETSSSNVFTLGPDSFPHPVTSGDKNWFMDFFAPVSTVNSAYVYVFKTFKCFVMLYCIYY